MEEQKGQVIPPQDSKPEENKQEQKPEDKKPRVVIQVIMLPDGVLELKSNLPVPMTIYALESIKYNIMRDAEENSKSMIVKPQDHNFFNRLRNMKRR